MNPLYLARRAFLDEATTMQVVEEMKRCHAAAAPVYGGEKPGGAVNPYIRKVSRLAIAPEISERIKALLMREKDELAQHFEVELTHCEEPQFLRYETGDFFVMHQDGNTPMVHDHTRFRKVSVSVYLSLQGEPSAPETYGGGELVLYSHYSAPGERVFEPRGTLVAFRSETTHEVLPITHGERYVIVTWFRNDEPKA